MKLHVQGGIRNQEDLVTEDGVIAEGNIPLSLRGIQADTRFEPLPNSVDQADECNRYSKQAFGDSREAIETFFGCSIQDLESAQRADAGRFVCGLER
jgi:hypothetical protein